MLISDDGIVNLFQEIAEAVHQALEGLNDWGEAGTRPGQYRSDLAADAVALRLIERSGLGVLSEESGIARADSGVTVIVDPVDGSTNASRGLPWFATSLCAVDRDGPRVALVVNQFDGTRFSAVRGNGAYRNGVEIKPARCVSLSSALVGLSGLPSRHLGWRQFRALGACALDLCGVASGALDAFVDCSDDAHGVWDYAGGLLVCQEAGAHVVDALGRALVVLDHAARRTPVAAGSSAVLAELVEARNLAMNS